MKRLIGRSFDEPEVQEEIKGLPFKVKATPSGGVAYEVTYDGETKLFTPEQVRGGAETMPFIMLQLACNSYRCLHEWAFPSSSRLWR
jgi:hypothetical protein